MRGIIERGRGKDLVMMHGYLSSKESFYPQIEYFSKFYKVTAFDFPGFGEGEELTQAFSVDDYADWTTDFFRRQGIERPFVIAHSFGGRVAVKCMSRDNTIGRAVLCGCAGVLPPRGLSYRIKVSAYRAVRRIAPRYAERKFGSPEYRTLSPLMRESYKKIVNEDLIDCAKNIRCPVLFINGERDGETPVSSVKKYLEVINDSKMIVIKGAGHFAHLDDPLAFNLAAEEFFQ